MIGKNIFFETMQTIKCSSCKQTHSHKISEFINNNKSIQCPNCNTPTKNIEYIRKRVIRQANSLAHQMKDSEINRVFHTYFTNDFLMYLKKIGNEINMYRSRYIFRGIPAPGIIESSARYRLTKDSKNKGLAQKYRQIDFINYHQNLIEQGRKNITAFASSNLSDIEILAEIQHYGGATCLIDFSYNYLIALYFASESYKIENQQGKPIEQNGKIFVVDLYNPRNEKIYLLNEKYMNKNIEEILMKRDDYDDGSGNIFQQPRMWMWQPNKLNNRIVKQDSVFLFCMAQIKRDSNLEYQMFSVREKDKTIIRTILSTYFNITAETIFDDLQGYSNISNGRKVEINENMLKHGTCLTYGRELYRQEDYISAENILDNSINCLKEKKNGKDNKCKNKCETENLVDIYLFKARTMEKLRNYHGSLKYYEKCLETLEKHFGPKAINLNIEDENKIKYYQERKRSIYLEKLHIYYVLHDYENVLQYCLRIIEQQDYHEDIKFLLSIIELSIITSSKNEYEKYMMKIYIIITNRKIVDAISKYELFKFLGTIVFGENSDIKTFKDDFIDNIKIEYKPLVEWNYNNLYYYFKHPNKNLNDINRDKILEKIKETEDYDQLLYKEYYLSKADF